MVRLRTEQQEEAFSSCYISSLFPYLSASSRLAASTAGAVAESLVIITDRCPNTEVKSSIKAMKKSTGAASIVKMFSCL